MLLFLLVFKCSSCYSFGMARGNVSVCFIVLLKDSKPFMGDLVKAATQSTGGWQGVPEMDKYAIQEE